MRQSFILLHGAQGLSIKGHIQWYDATMLLESNWYHVVEEQQGLSQNKALEPVITVDFSIKSISILKTSRFDNSNIWISDFFLDWCFLGTVIDPWQLCFGKSHEILPSFCLVWLINNLKTSNSETMCYDTEKQRHRGQDRRPNGQWLLRVTSTIFELVLDDKILSL